MDGGGVGDLDVWCFGEGMMGTWGHRSEEGDSRQSLAEKWKRVGQASF